MKVFLLWCEHYEDRYLVGIFDSIEKAKAKLLTLKPCDYQPCDYHDPNHCGDIDESEVQ